MSIHDRGASGTLYSNTVHLKDEAPVTACGKFVHPGCSELYVILTCLMSSSLVKQCCDIIQYGKYIISMGAKCGLCGPEFCCAVCGQALSWRRITPSLRRLGHSPDGLWQAFQCGLLLGVK